MTGYEYDLFKICCFSKAFDIENYLIINFVMFLYIHIFIMETNFMHYHRSGRYVAVQVPVGKKSVA
jgi:hypothetical protein